MADRDAAKFQTSVEKAVADYANSVNDVIENMKRELRVLSMGLGKEMKQLDVPDKGTVKEIEKVIAGAVAAETKSFKGFLDIEIDFDFDEKTRKTKGCSVSMSGDYLKL